MNSNETVDHDLAEDILTILIVEGNRVSISWMIQSLRNRGYARLPRRWHNIRRHELEEDAQRLGFVIEREYRTRAGEPVVWRSDSDEYQPTHLLLRTYVTLDPEGA